jgi:hypothetical protein
VPLLKWPRQRGSPDRQNLDRVNRLAVVAVLLTDFNQTRFREAVQEYHAHTTDLVVGTRLGVSVA